MIDDFQNILKQLPVNAHCSPMVGLPGINSFIDSSILTTMQKKSLEHWIKLQPKLIKKFGTSNILCDQFGYEQSSSLAVSKYKASLIQSGSVLDLCCGIGADSISLSDKVNVLGVDLSAERLKCFDYNHTQFRPNGQHEIALHDVISFNQSSDCFLIDPDRRPKNKQKSWGLDQLSPNLDELKRIVSRLHSGLIKLSPASDVSRFSSLFDFSSCYIGDKGQSKELLLKTGKFQNNFKETVFLPTNEILEHTINDEINARASLISQSSPKSYIHEPIKPSLSSGLYWVEAATLGLLQLNFEIPYFVSENPINSSFWSSFKVIDEVPFREKKIKSFLKCQDFDELEVKKRGLDIDPLELQRTWKRMMPNNHSNKILTAFLLPDSRNKSKPRIIFAQRVNSV